MQQNEAQQIEINVVYLDDALVQLLGHGNLQIKNARPGLCADVQEVAGECVCVCVCVCVWRCAQIQF